MTIFLPENVTEFRHAFDETCKHISSRDQDCTFYTLLFRLIHSLRAHALVKNLIQEADLAISTKKQDFSAAALEAVEEQGKNLWKYHPSYKYRKQLVMIKRIVTGPTGTGFKTLYDSIQFSIKDFCYQSRTQIQSK